MIDLFALGLTHALLALAAWRLTARADLDQAGGGGKRRPWRTSDAAAADD